MEHLFELARQRHDHDIQKARESYCFYTSDEAKAAAATAATVMATEPTTTKLPPFDQRHWNWDEYAIVTTHGKIPDFADSLERNLFVSSKETPLFTATECHDLIARAEHHFQQEPYNGEWGSLKSGRYPVSGFWIHSVPTVQEWFNDMVKSRLFPLLQAKFPNFVNSLDDLVVDNAYVFKYTPETGRRTDVHTDSGCLSFTICFNGGPHAETDFEGGGTWFQGLQTIQKSSSGSSGSSTEKSPTRTGNDASGGVVEMSMGQCTVRPGGVRHYGCAVTSGTRYIIGGFCMNAKKVEYVRMLQNVGIDLRAKGDLIMATKAFEAAIALNPDTDGPYSHYAQALKDLGQEQKAQTVLEHCLTNVNPVSGEVAYSLGTMYMKQQLHDKVKRCMEVCLQADEHDVDAMMCMSQACAGLGDEMGEKQWYERIAYAPVSVDVQIQSQAFCNLGVMAQGTPQEVELYQKSLELTPNAFPPHYSLASAYASKEDWDLALEWFHKAVSLATPGTREESMTLRNMYKVVMSKVNQEHSESANPNDMRKLFMTLMGHENFEKLAVILKQ
jgi:hypothetical protein